jgi:tRNA threonylcarbamoyl adenosine modification protein (Sua5/YciO/YrdC/YwlC family)
MKTEVVSLTAENPDIEKIQAAARMLDEGRLVAFPTETVYGIGCRARAETIRRLDEVKGRGTGKRYTLHIADLQDVARYVPKIPPRGKKLIASGWPGPLTIVFELDEEAIERQHGLITNDAFEVLYPDNTIGIRCPDNRIAKELLGLATHPIVAPSANLNARPPAASAGEVLEQFEAKIDLILDGGECKYGKSSSVVKITHNGLTILREGTYGEKDVTEMSSIKILFVCTGNTCRSPMAAAYCRKYISEKLDCGVDETEGMGYKITSAGVMAGPEMPASREVVDICAAKGIDVSGHRSRVLTREEAEESDYIFVMTKGHRDRILEVCPAASQKCMLLDGTGEISDPIGAGDDVYRICAEQIEKALEKRMNEILI